jgi:hypothetical protein
VAGHGGGVLSSGLEGVDRIPKSKVFGLVQNLVLEANFNQRHHLET